MSDDQPEPDVGMLTAAFMRAVQDELFETLAEQGHPDVRPRHGSVLAFLDRDGTRATEVAQRSGQHKQIVGTIVDELVNLGYVSREPDPRDRRAKLVVPTAHGLDEISRARAILAAIERRHEQTFGAEGFAEFKAALQRITRLQRRWRDGRGARPEQ
ncbi:MarR family winged helix-turn-helix transcriptional regulator [Micromonospora sp. NPDC005553]|uniref:MarR family winged helix-turn-helix transcriptional regulator n=1 Tax=unclassified Micromonospora TaxID=2617518 RepID=UPI0033BFB1F5